MTTLKSIDASSLRDQVRLELIQVNVQGAVETKRCGDGGYDLSNETVQVGEAGGSDAQPLLANVVNRIVVHLMVSRLSDHRQPRMTPIYSP